MNNLFNKSISIGLYTENQDYHNSPNKGSRPRTLIENTFIKHIEQVSERKFLLYWLTKIIDYQNVNETFNQEDLTMTLKQSRFHPTLPGEIFQHVVENDKHLYVVDEVLHGDRLKFTFLGTNLITPLIKINDNIDVYPNEIANHKTKEILVTSPGLLILNQRLFVESFGGDPVPYVNKEIKVGWLDELLAHLLIEDKITVEQAHHFTTNCYDIGYFGELCNRNFTSKSFTTDPRIKERKKELYGNLTDEQKKDPIVLSKIEEELLKMDREWLKDDDADFFHSAQGGKSYDIHRKKMFITVGVIPAFSDKNEVEYNLIENALTEGWDKNNFDVIVNEIYKGSYSRGAETAKGGELTKYVLRVFQDLKITEYDCNTTLGCTIELNDVYDHKHNLTLLGRNLLGNNQPIDIEFLKKNAGKKIIMRDPLYCKCKTGLCFKCMGNNFEKIGEENIGSYILDISSGIMMIPMKNMHGTKVSTFDIEMKDFLITT